MSRRFDSVLMKFSDTDGASYAWISFTISFILKAIANISTNKSARRDGDTLERKLSNSS
jgi:hypothetical protein